MTPRFGIGFQSNKTPSEYVELARLVDRYDFDVIAGAGSWSWTLHR